MRRVVEERDEEKGEVRPVLDELGRGGARRMLAHALDVEVEAYLERHKQERDDEGLALVVRNGQARAASDRRLGHAEGPGATRERPARHRRGATEVHERDPAALLAAVEN